MSAKKNDPKVFQLLSGKGKVYAILMLLTGCTPSINGSFCDIYEPVYLDYDNDTPETIRQVDRNNVVYDGCNQQHQVKRSDISTFLVES